ncbi:MAG: hypothetical protein AAB250_13740 [Bdellovibrionota bacterium]
MKLRLIAALSAFLVAAPASAGIWDLVRPKPAQTETTNAERQTVAEPTLTLDEFKSLAVELAPRVDLFRDGWAEAPTCQFFGGTSRDYLYWLKGQLNKADSPAELQQIIRDLRARKEIKIREFVAAGSDVDVIVRDGLNVDAAKYGVKKIDRINKARFDLERGMGQTEVWQGFIPIEKIRLSQTAVFTNVQFGDGVRELFESKPTARFASDADFARSYYAQLGINHPILLALRYLKAVSLDFKINNGNRNPKLAEVLERMDDASKQAVMRIMKQAANGFELRHNLDHENKAKFMEWFESAVKKAGGPNSHAEVTAMLFDHFGVDEILRRYPEFAPLSSSIPARMTCPRVFGGR